MLRTILCCVAVALVACTPPYGRDSCKTSSDCVSGQFCPSLCTPADGGMPEANVSALCSLECTTDADCGNLGLKKPVCALYSCTGQRVCADNPF